jgi:hypothetical protein
MMSDTRDDQIESLGLAEFPPCGFTFDNVNSCLIVVGLCSSRGAMMATLHGN